MLCGKGLSAYTKYRMVLHSPIDLQSTTVPFPKQQILDSSKLKGFADYNFEFDENGRKFSIRVENIVGEGEITISPFHIVFSKDLCCRQVEIRACLAKA